MQAKIPETHRYGHVGSMVVLSCDLVQKAASRSQTVMFYPAVHLQHYQVLAGTNLLVEGLCRLVNDSRPFRAGLRTAGNMHELADRSSFVIAFGGFE